MSYKNIDTQVVQEGFRFDPATNSRAVPIYQTTAYEFNSAEHAADLFALKDFGNIYTRLMNPTSDVLEKRLAAIFGGSSAVATASGMSAIFYAVTAITSAGQNIVCSGKLYGGTITLFTQTLKKFGIEARVVDSNDKEALETAIDENTRLVYCETIGNPKCNIEDIEALADIAHRHDLPLVVDATVSPPPISNPFDFGADIVVLSLTKIIGGHGTSMGGAIIEKGTFNWDNGKFPEISGPDESYHGYDFWAVFGNHDKAVLAGYSFTLKIRCGLLRDTGAAISPFNSQQILLGVETLPLRARRMTDSAQEIAEWLQAHPKVDWVSYPGLASSPDNERARKYCKTAPGAILGFAPKGGFEASKKFVESVELISHLANILDARTLVIHPASTTHQQLSEDELLAAGVTPDFVRLSIGLEDVVDIKADIEQALAKSL